MTGKRTGSGTQKSCHFYEYIPKSIKIRKEIMKEMLRLSADGEARNHIWILIGFVMTVYLVSMHVLFHI